MIIKGAVAIVTGGASGIGYAFCRELLKQGAASVALFDVTKKAGIDAQDSLQAEFGSGCAKFIECDVTKDADLKEAMSSVVATNGKLDILCNNAGIGEYNDGWEKCVDINLRAVIYGTKLGMELMSSGVIVNTASSAGVQPISYFPVYTATKHAVVGFTRAIAPVAMAKKGIRVNSICPHYVETPLMQTPMAFKLRETLEQKDNIVFMSPEAVAKGLIQIIADDSKNGEALVILGEDKSGYHLFNELGVFKPNM